MVIKWHIARPPHIYIFGYAKRGTRKLIIIICHSAKNVLHRLFVIIYNLIFYVCILISGILLVDFFLRTTDLESHWIFGLKVNNGIFLDRSKLECQSRNLFFDNWSLEKSTKRRLPARFIADLLTISFFIKLKTLVDRKIPQIFERKKPNNDS